MARYELVEGTSSKFWEIVLAGTSVTVRFGRIGTAGQEQTKSFATDAIALVEHDKLVREKTKKGYALVGGAAPASASTAVPAPAPVPAPSTPDAAASDASLSATASSLDTTPDGWVTAGEYALSIRDGKIVARNRKGKELASVPKDVKETEPYAALADALELLDAHAAECRDIVELWMLRSLPVPTDVLLAVWPDPAWRAQLENAVVLPGDGSSGDGSAGEGGVLRGVDPVRGLGVVTLDGESRWLRPAVVTLPHPILLPDLDDWRGLLADVGLTQGIGQLFRETFVRPAEPKGSSVDEFSGGEFDLLGVAIGIARRHGWRVRGGAACCAVYEGGRGIEARYDLGEGDPSYETTTGSLGWVDALGASVELTAVGPIAWSEGMRMAATIYKQRKVETATEDEA